MQCGAQSKCNAKLTDEYDEAGIEVDLARMNARHAEARVFDLENEVVHLTDKLLVMSKDREALAAEVLELKAAPPRPPVQDCVPQSPCSLLSLIRRMPPFTAVSTLKQNMRDGMTLSPVGTRRRRRITWQRP